MPNKVTRAADVEQSDREYIMQQHEKRNAAYRAAQAGRGPMALPRYSETRSWQLKDQK